MAGGRASAGRPAGRSAMAEVLITVRNYVKEYPILDRPGLLFTGNPGTGKTHLAVAALRQLIGRGFEGIFFDYQNLLERIRAGYDPTSGVSSELTTSAPGSMWPWVSIMA